MKIGLSLVCLPLLMTAVFIGLSVEQNTQQSPVRSKPLSDCFQEPGKEWWKQTVFYQVYMPSYADSDGNGYGDFAGMTKKLDYLQSLGIRGIWLTPFLKSPKVDNGYDVASYYEVDPIYGDTASFKLFIREAHKRNIRVIMDMVLNHTSTDSEWFKESRKSSTNPYRDYYIWKDKPNNWESFFGGTAWQKDTLTGQYYYHKFDRRMADLNWANPAVVNEISNVLRYWLKMEVDGFRLDVINFLTTDGILADNPMKNGEQQHMYDIDQPGVKAAIQKIRAVVNEYPNRFLVGEIGSDKIDVLRKYQSPDLLNVVFNFNFGSIGEFSTRRIYDEMQSMEKNMSGYPTVFFGSHDMPRMIDRLGVGNDQKAIALAALLLTAKGVPFIYYGEEIGMHNTIARNADEIKDIQGRNFYKLAIEKGETPEAALIEGNAHNRDKSRSPMQWSNSHHAGFTTGTPWMPVNPDYTILNAAAQVNKKTSTWKSYQSLIALRNQQPALQFGSYQHLKLMDECISFDRVYQQDTIHVIINFGKPRLAPLTANQKLLAGSKSIAKNSFAVYK